MIKTVELKTLEEVSAFILDREYNPQIKRLRNQYLYRGMYDAMLPLTTSLKRNCGSKSAELEPSILRYFTKYAIIDDPSLTSSVWKQMIVGQHYGLPTRLLDWTHSALIALHFATSEDNYADTDKHDGLVWRIDTGEISRLLPPKYKTVLDKDNTSTFSVDTIYSVARTTEQYDADMKDTAMAIIEPPSTDQRIINQYSYFSIIPDAITDVEDFLNKNTSKTTKFIINRNIRWDLRDILDQANISERIVYPGLDGLSKWIARHYYVKED